MYSHTLPHSHRHYLQTLAHFARFFAKLIFGNAGFSHSVVVQVIWRKKAKAKKYTLGARNWFILHLYQQNKTFWVSISMYSNQEAHWWYFHKLTLLHASIFFVQIQHVACLKQCTQTDLIVDTFTHTDTLLHTHLHTCLHSFHTPWSILATFGPKQTC